MDELISRAAAQTELQLSARRYTVAHEAHGEGQVVWSESLISVSDAMNVLRKLPSAEPEIKPIEYLDCANAMLKMWMDNVVTDGEYNRIMDKLYAHWGMKNG
jgi:hypothetical protein